MVPVLCVLAAIVLLMFVRSGLSQRPGDLGVSGGQLRPCPASPNCVCSQHADVEHAIAPFAIQGDGEAEWERLRQAIQNTSRAVIVTETPDYLHAEFTSLIFRFVDDVELFRAPADGVIHVRSASRVGYSDLGVNRQRVEKLRKALRP